MENNESNTVGEIQSDEASSSVTTAAIVGSSSNNELRPKIFKLNVDCFELVFEWMSLKELLAFRRTCKRMKAVVDYYIKLNYPRLMRNGRSMLSFSPVRLDCFKWIKHLKLSCKLTDTQIESIAYVLNHLESLVLWWVKIDGDLYETILKHCLRLKYLCVETKTKTMVGTGNEWLQRQYPTLEHIEIMFVAPLHVDQPPPCSELLTFFQLNPNVRMFSTNCTLLSIYRDIFLGSNIKLDRLFINITSDLSSICRLTNELYEQGFYEDLHLEVRENMNRQHELHHLWSFRNIEKLSCRCIMSDLVPPKTPAVESIKEVSIERIFFPFSNTPTFMSMRLINLKRVNMQIARLRDIQLFVSHAPKLAQIRIYRFLTGVADDLSDEPSADDFLALNEERKNLAGACKVVIYVQEKLFLQMKWSATWKFSMIELKRMNSCEIEHIPVEEWHIYP